MDFVYKDDHIIVCVKPPRVLSTDEPGGVPDLVRQELGDPKVDIRTVHRLDRVVSGLMVVARTAKAASELSRQIREDTFQKQYLAVLHGHPQADTGTLVDLLQRDKARKMTMVVQTPGKDAREAILDYRVEHKTETMSRVRIDLKTGRTHQIRVQFSSRNLPLVGERKYAVLDDPCEIALWSCYLGFTHPETGAFMEFELPPPEIYPWTSC